LFCLLVPPPPQSTLFPYTSLFRSEGRRGGGLAHPRGAAHVGEGRRREAARPGRVVEGGDGPSAPVGRERDAQGPRPRLGRGRERSEEHTSELQSRFDLVCRLLLEK